MKAGFGPSFVRLAYDPQDPYAADQVVSQCQALHATMLAWEADKAPRRTIYDGTFATLIKLYQTDPDSPYHDLKQGTQQNYSKHLRLLGKMIGTRYIAGSTGADTRRWYKTIAEPDMPGGRPRTGYAYLMMNILKVVVSFGASMGHRECMELREQMSATTFKAPPARKERITYEQVTAFCAAAHACGRPSAALWLRMQYEFGMRRRDIIGEWVRDTEGTNGIRRGGKVWRDGLTWVHIDAKRVLRKMISKTEFSTAREAVHRIDDYPDLVVELDRIPPERRVGPIVLNESTGLPYTPEQCRHYFRVIARLAGIPDAVWNMDARAGAVSEAYESGATTEGAMALAAHTQVATSRRYLRDTLQQTSRVAQLRVKSRQPKE